jgi:hypothetical protein
MLSLVLAAPHTSLGGDAPGYTGQKITTADINVNDRTPGRGIDPSISCVDANGDGVIGANECGGRDWSWTTLDPQVPIGVNTQNGTGVPSGSSSATFNQDANQSISVTPHLTVRYYNQKSAPSTTATAGVTSTGTSASRTQHNEYGFEIIVDKKNDPLEPYYQRFAMPYYAVDSQTDANGNMVGQASVTYEKTVTEMDPSNPGVYNRYTVTGTASSSGATGAYSSQCESGCPTDSQGASYDPETGWTHPWQ